MSKILLAAALCFMMTQTLFGKDLSKGELEAVQKKLKSYEQMTMDFVKESYKARYKRKTSVAGKSYFKKPNKFRWVYGAPMNEEIIFDGASVVQVFNEKNTANRHSATGAMAKELSQIVDLVLNMDQLLSQFDLVKATESADKVAIDLKPKREGDITQLSLVVIPSQSLVKSVKMTFKDKNTTEFQFKNPKMDPLPPEVFQIPQGMKVKEIN